jgi:RNA-dependent RNA polymerase
MLALDYESEIEEQESIDIPEYCTRTPRLLITPTRLALVGFSVEMSNRVVRHFVTNVGFEPERFLRVTIGEENGARMFSDELSPGVCARIENLIMNGVCLNGHNYHFLAYSSSQLKECSLWMVDAQDPWNVDSIRNWMGDFTMCEGPSKVAARMGQCFSTTIVASDANNTSWSGRIKDDFPDVLCSHNGKEMCHSDGTGLIERSV